MKSKFIIFTLLLLGAVMGSHETFADTLINQDITQNTHWTKVGSPYQIFTDETKAIVVHKNAILTIDPGVVVKFSHGSGLDVQGKLIAIGKKHKFITFTSLYDNGNQDLDTAYPGDWHGLLVRGDYSALKYVHIKYAGEPGFQGKAPSFSVMLMGRFVHLTNSVIEKGAGNGVWLHFYRHGLVHNNLIQHHSGHGVLATESVADVFHNIIQNNEKNGVVIEGQINLHANLIRNNSENGVLVKAPRRTPQIHDNKIHDNGQAGIEVKSGRPRLHHNILHNNLEEGSELRNEGR